jgi:hypothetical protein
MTHNVIRTVYGGGLIDVTQEKNTATIITGATIDALLHANNQARR